VKPIPERQEMLDRFIAKYFPEPAPDPGKNGHARASSAGYMPTDEEVIEKCRSAKNAAKFSDLFDHGDVQVYHGGDDSRADLSLLGILGFWTQDKAQLERLFSASALGQRAKWQNRPDYRRRTIDRALSDLKETYTWLSSSSHPLGGPSDDENNETPQIVWFSELGEPKEREYLIERVGAKGYPVVAFGAGGVAKSFAMLAAGIAIASASGADEWLGLRILDHGYVLYVDFELDVEEHHRRVRDLCAGLGVPVPKRLAYLSGVGITTDAAFRLAREFVKERQAKAVIIDSMGLAMEGDGERGKDVLAFHRRYTDPLRRLGATPFIVDHEGKLQVGEKHKNKSPIGSAYKAWASRSVLQFELDEYDKENAALDIRVRHTKVNFGAPLDPFGVRFTFEAQKVSIESIELPDTDLVEEDVVPLKQRIIAALRVEPATNPELQEITGADAGSIRNKLSELKQEGLVEDGGYKGRNKLYCLLSSSPPPPRGNDSDDNNKEQTPDVQEEL
jgi:hypothetical protein